MVAVVFGCWCCIQHGGWQCWMLQWWLNCTVVLAMETAQPMKSTHQWVLMQGFIIVLQFMLIIFLQVFLHQWKRVLSSTSRRQIKRNAFSKRRGTCSRRIHGNFISCMSCRGVWWWLTVFCGGNGEFFFRFWFDDGCWRVECWQREFGVEFEVASVF